MLIVENGTIVANANSYISLADARALATELNVTLPVDDTAAETALKSGARHIDEFEPRFDDLRVNATQTMSWPRINAKNTFGFTIAKTAIPSQMLGAQVIAAGEFGAGVDPDPNSDGKSVASEEVSGAVSISYFNSGKIGKGIRLIKVENFLAPLLVVNPNSVSRG